MTVHLKSLRRLSTITGVAALMASVSVPALAQEIETVIVTTERHAEDLQKVPDSVATLSGDEISDILASGQDIRALSSRVPSLYAESSNGRAAPRFYIRGLGNSDFDLAASQPVSIIEDNVVQENVVLKSAPLYDQEGVEVDRGPQGTLFGRNTTAGIIKFTSRAPTDALNGYASASYGELGTANVEGALGVPLSDTVSVRASAIYQHRDDYIDNAFLGVNDALGGYDERAARLQLLYKPSDDFSVLLNVHGRSLDGTAAIFRANIIGPGNNHLNGNYIDDKVFFDGGFVDPKNENPQKYDGIGTNATIKYDFSNMELTSITGYETTHGYSRGDIDGGNTVTGPGLIFFPSDTQDGLDYLNQFTQELHLASTDTASPLFWQVGGFYFSTKYQDTTQISFAPAPVLATSVRQSNVSWAVFGQVSYHVTDALTVTGGVRWTSDVKALTANGGLLAVPIVVPAKTTGDNVSWDVSAAYAVNDDVNLYARIATGFRAPSIQGRNLAFDEGFSTARSETITSYEAGIKTLLDDHKIRLNLDGFYYYIQHPQFSAVGGAAVGNSIVLLNARAGFAYGLEADAEYTPLDNLTLTAGLSWNHTEIDDPNLAAGVCAQCNVTNPPGPFAGTVLVNGNPFPQAPDYTGTFTAKYSWPFESGAELYAYTDWYIQGYTNFFLYKSLEFHSNGNYEGGLRIGYILPSKDWEFAVYARNITDKKNLQGGIDFDDNTGFVGDPRVIGAEVTAHLN